MSVTLMARLDALCAHLAGFELPELFSVEVITATGQPTVTAHLSAHQLPQIAAGLLAWADTLTTATAEVWRTPGGDSVHLSVTGHLTAGVTICVYSAVSFTPHGIGADLAPGGKKSVPWAVLSHLATPGEVTL